MSLEIKAGEEWKHLDYPLVEGDNFKPADGLQIPPNGRKRGLHGPNDLYVLIEHQLGVPGGYFTEVVFVNLPDCDSLKGRGRIKAFDPHYPLNSLVVQLKHPGECLEWGKQGTPEYLRIDHLEEKPSQREIAVIKIGGSTYEERANILKDIALLHRKGKALVVVHGGGVEIDTALKAAGIQPKKVNGKRVTDAETLNIVVEVLEKINGDIKDQLIGLDVPSCRFLPDHRLLQTEITDPSLGLVGGIPEVDESGLSLLVNYTSHGVVPVVCPIAVQKSNPLQKLNVNADTSAGAIAASLSKAKLFLLTDVPGVMDENGLLINELTPSYYATLKQQETIRGGMLPKIEACLPLVQKGGTALIFGGRVWEAFLPSPNGTTIKQ